MTWQRKVQGIAGIALTLLVFAVFLVPTSDWISGVDDWISGLIS